MTVKKSTLRPRRSTGADNLPRALTEWFNGELRRQDQSSVPWEALIYPDNILIYGRWQIWAEAHPGAKPPIDWEWIAQLPPERAHGVPWAVALSAAQKCSRRGR